MSAFTKLKAIQELLIANESNTEIEMSLENFQSLREKIKDIAFEKNGRNSRGGKQLLRKNPVKSIHTLPAERLNEWREFYKELRDETFFKRFAERRVTTISLFRQGMIKYGKTKEEMLEYLMKEENAMQFPIYRDYMKAENVVYPIDYKIIQVEKVKSDRKKKVIAPKEIISIDKLPEE
jgi:hypothetical protein